MMRLTVIVIGICVGFAAAADARGSKASKPMKNRSAEQQEKHARCLAASKAKYGDLPSSRMQREKATAACDAKP